MTFIQQELAERQTVDSKAILRFPVEALEFSFVTESKHTKNLGNEYMDLHRQ